MPASLMGINAFLYNQINQNLEQVVLVTVQAKDKLSVYYFLWSHTRYQNIITNMLQICYKYVTIL